MGTKIYVGNLPYTCDDEQLRQLFGSDGRNVADVAIITDRMTGQPRGFAFVNMASDEDAKRSYDVRQSRYAVPERRQVQQISFPNATEADAASKQIAGGLIFDALAAERKLTDKDIDLGTVTKAEMIDPAIANAAFGLAEGGVSGPVTGRFATAIVRVVKIEPGSTKPLTEVESEIKHDIAVDRAKGARLPRGRCLGACTGVSHVARIAPAPPRPAPAPV